VFLFSETSSLTDLMTSIVQRVGDDIDRKPATNFGIDQNSPFIL
jgi:hypothetical protein